MAIFALIQFCQDYELIIDFYKEATITIKDFHWTVP